MDKSYKLGVVEILPLLARLEAFRMRRFDPTTSLSIQHDKLAKLSITQVPYTHSMSQVVSVLQISWLRICAVMDARAVR